MVAHFSAEAEYQAMAHTACELICIQLLWFEMSVVSSQSMVMHCDNDTAMYCLKSCNS